MLQGLLSPLRVGANPGPVQSESTWFRNGDRTVSLGLSRAGTARRPRSDAQVQALTLRAEEAQDLHRRLAGASEPVRRAGVELRGLTWLHHQVVLGDHEA